MKYRLTKQGFMKQFEGSWKVDPLYFDAQGNPTSENVASVVHLEQVNFCTPSLLVLQIFGLK
jgi:hypothetical protein